MEYQRRRKCRRRKKKKQQHVRKWQKREKEVEKASA